MSGLTRFVRCLIALTLIATTAAALQPTRASAEGGLELLSPAFNTGEPLSAYEPSISADGRFVAFYSDDCCHTAEADTNDRNDIFVRDRQTQTTILVTKTGTGTAAGFSGDPIISGDGNFVAFTSFVPSFVPGDTNGVFDIFVWERSTGTIERVSIATNGTQGNADSKNPTLSADGRFVVFESFATNLVPGDTNASKDVFVRDRLLATTTLVSVAHDGGMGDEWSKDAEITADGRYVVFNSLSTNIISTTIPYAAYIYLRDLQAGTTELVSVNAQGEPSNQGSYQPTLSAFDARFIAFQSEATNLAPVGPQPQNHIFLRDRDLGTTTLVSTSQHGVPGDSTSEHPVLSGDGQFVIFPSWASTLVENDTSGTLGPDFFVRDNVTGQVMLPAINEQGDQMGTGTPFTDISWDGRFVVFDGGRAAYLREVQWSVPTAITIAAFDALPSPATPLLWLGLGLLAGAALLHWRAPLRS